MMCVRKLPSQKSSSSPPATTPEKELDAWRWCYLFTVQLGTPRGRYDEYTSKVFPSVKKPRYINQERNEPNDWRWCLDRGDLTHRGRGQGLGRATLVCGALVAPLRLLFGSLEASGKNKTSGTCFVQFREYFLCSFFETQKQQKTGNWHCGDLLIS
jgi:hypothetical protein